MTEEAKTRAALDEAVRAHAAPYLATDGEVIVSWIALAATRRHDGGGVIISMASDEALPCWEARGILHEALTVIDRIDDDE